MTKKKKNQIELAQVRDELTTLTGRVTSLENQVKALTFMLVNPEGITIKSSCDMNQDTAQWVSGDVFHHKITATYIHPVTMELTTVDFIKFTSNVTIKMGRFKYDSKTGFFEYIITYKKNDKTVEYKVESNLHAPYYNTHKVWMQIQKDPSSYPEWIEVPTPATDKCALVFS